MITHVFLNLTSFDETSLLKIFPRLLSRLSRESGSVKCKILSDLKWRGVANPESKLEFIAQGKLSCNWVDVSISNCMLPEPFGTAKWLKAQIMWNAAAYCWDELSDDTELEVEVTQSDAGVKHARARWEAAVAVRGLQSVKRLEPSVCSLVWEIASPLSVEAVAVGVVSLLDLMAADEVPEDLRVYANYGEDIFADGGMNIVLGSRGVDREREGWKHRFLRAKPILGAVSCEIEEVAKFVGVTPVAIAARTVSGATLSLISIRRDQLIAAAKSADFNSRFIKVL